MKSFIVALLKLVCFPAIIMICTVLYFYDIISNLINIGYTHNNYFYSFVKWIMTIGDKNGRN